MSFFCLEDHVMIKWGNRHNVLHILMDRMDRKWSFTDTSPDRPHTMDNAINPLVILSWGTRKKFPMVQQVRPKPATSQFCIQHPNNYTTGKTGSQLFEWLHKFQGYTCQGGFGMKTKTGISYLIVEVIASSINIPCRWKGKDDLIFIISVTFPLKVERGCTKWM